MKKIHLLLLGLTICLFSACHNDIWDAIDGLDSRVTKLEELCKEMNTNITSLQTIVDVLQSNDFITGVVEIKKDGEVIGYTITFGKHDPITIYHGQDGKDGADGKDGQDGQNGSANTPVIGVAQDTDGVYYWTLNGEWLLDDNGNKLPVSGKDGQNGTNGSNGQDGADGKDGQDGEDGKDGADGQDGKDGITPQLKIEDGYWYISYDNGATWTQLGKAAGEDGADGADGKDGQNGADGKDGQDGDSMFQSVTQDENYVYFTLADGTVIKIAKGNGSNDQPNEDDIIDFKDLAVKSALLKLGVDTTKDNEISYGEAAAYDGKILMEGNTNIYSFKEFQYFTNTTSFKFQGCSNLFEIIIPNSIDSLLEYAFEGCASLTSIVIPNAVNYIGADAFSGCKSLHSIIIPSSITNIRHNAFYNCPSLKSFTFPENYNGDTFIFGKCSSSTVELPHTIYWNTIEYQKEFYEYQPGSYSFTTSGLGGAVYKYYSSTSNWLYKPTNIKCIVFGDKVKTIPNYICAYLQEITEINIPNNVISIGNYAFFQCTALNSIIIGNNVNKIGEHAFSGCSKLTSITIPNSVTNIGSSAFSACSSLTTITSKSTTPPLLGTNAIPTTIGIIYVPRSSIEEYKIVWSDYADKIIGYDFE
ncbi:MAG: leucine-rich repeat protein [Paludibacteraceae bacterium]|nr:leucine-rich repeat protein [Paludibacteraceae bacterium]